MTTSSGRNLGGELGGEGCEDGVVVGGGEELRAGAVRFAGDGDGGQAGEAGWSGVAEDGAAGFGVVGSGAKFADGGAGGNQEVVSFEEGRHLGAEVG